MKKILLLFIVLIFIGSTSFIWKQKKILIIGDSISIGYTPQVWRTFQGKALVTHNPGNGQHTGTGLEKIEEWIGAEEWDLIQINWGLWNLAYRNSDSKNPGNRDKVNGKVTFTVAEYAQNLDQLVSRIKQLSNAQLVFVTTTYVPEDEIGRKSSDVELYNAAAKEVMKKHGIPVNDIYPASIAIHREHGLGNTDVHYTEKGYNELGKIVADFLQNQLLSPQSPNHAKSDSDEALIHQLIQESFDSLFSGFNEELIPNYYTDDFLLLEQGEIWGNAIISNYFRNAKKQTPLPVRNNRFEFISTKIDGDRAWVAYHNFANISRNGQAPRAVQWLESATAIRTADGWRLDMLHSTRVEQK